MSSSTCSVSFSQNIVLMKYIVNSLKLYNENELFPIIITSITYKEVDNPRIAFKNENGIIHLVLCFEHNKED